MTGKQEYNTYSVNIWEYLSDEHRLTPLMSGHRRRCTCPRVCTIPESQTPTSATTSLKPHGDRADTWRHTIWHRRHKHVRREKKEAHPVSLFYTQKKIIWLSAGFKNKSVQPHTATSLIAGCPRCFYNLDSASFIRTDTWDSIRASQQRPLCPSDWGWNMKQIFLAWIFIVYNIILKNILQFCIVWKRLNSNVQYE